MLLHRLLSFLLLTAAWTDSAVQDRACTPDNKGHRSCSSDSVSDESEVSSLLQWMRSHSRKRCPVPRTALDALQSGLNPILSNFLADVYEEIALASRQFDVLGCKVDCSTEAALNISGMSKLKIKGFDCNSGDCLDSTLGICTKWRAVVQIDWGALQLPLKGYGDANVAFRGACSLLEQLPDVPPFMTSLRIVKPRVTTELSADIQLVPPKISNAVFAPAAFTYAEVENFECGFRWLPVVEEICDDHLDSILKAAKNKILKLVNKQLQKWEPSLQDATARVAENGRVRKP